MEKKITSLESERKSFAKEHDEARFRLNTIDKSIDFHTRQVNETQADMEQFNRLARKDSDGNLLNYLKLNGIESQDIKILVARFLEISNKARTNGEYQQIGKTYGFKVVVKSEASQKDMFDFADNRFMVKGMGNIYYTYNNGHLANDPKLACMNFLSALAPKVI